METKLLLKSKTILGILITILGGALGQTDLTALLQLLHTGSTAQTIASGLLMAVGGGLTVYGRTTVPGAALRIGSLILRRVLEPDVIKEISDVAASLHTATAQQPAAPSPKSEPAEISCRITSGFIHG